MSSRPPGLIRLALISLTLVAVGCGQATPPPAPASVAHSGPPTAFQKVPRK